MPDYKVYEDKFCQGYIGILKKSKRYRQYLNVILKPGGIRVSKKEAQKTDSMMSDGTSRKKLNFLISTNLAGKSRQNVMVGGSQAPIPRGLQP